MFITVLGLVIAAGIFAYIFLPYLLDWEHEAEGYTSVEDTHGALMTQLADLEYDFRAGKLREEDYKLLRQELELELLRDQEGHRDEQGTPGP